MAHFNIQRARGTLPGKTTQVRANLDVRTGGQQVAQAVSALGGAAANLGMKWDLIEADTQLNDAKMKASQEHMRLILALPGIEPEKHEQEYDKSFKIRQALMPKNRRAAYFYGQYIKSNIPQWGLDVANSTKAKLTDNMRATGFVSQQGAIQTGNFKEYFKHLEKGKILGVYDAEEVVKYKQNTIENRERYVKLKTAEELEQLEIQREKNRDEISKLIRAGKSAGAAIEGAILDEKEQWMWFERERTETERRLKGKIIIVNQEEKRRLGDLIPDIWRDRISIDNVINQIYEARWPSDGSTPSIDDDVYDSLTTKARTELKAVQNESISDMIRDVSFELGVVEQSSMQIMLAMIEDKDDRQRMANDNQMKAARVNLFEEMIYDFLKDNPKAQRDEFEKFKKDTFPHLRKWEPGMRLPIERKGLPTRKEPQILSGVELDDIAPFLENAKVDRLTIYNEAGKLSPIWNELTKDEKLTAYQALAQGTTAQQIIDYFNRK